MNLAELGDMIHQANLKAKELNPMKPVLMMTDSSEEEYGGMQEFDTIKEAQEYAATTDGKAFRLYTLFSVGTVGKIEWNLTVDTATNMRENTKAKKQKEERRKAAPRSSSTWTALEKDTLIKNYKAGMPIKQIAAALGQQ